MRRANGSGTLLRYPRCKRWVIQFYVDGKRIREATGLTSRYEAQKILTQRLASVGKGEYVERPVKPCTVQELWQELVEHYRREGRLRSVRDLGDPAKPEAPQGRWRNIGPAFGYMRANRITTALLTAYSKRRREEEHAAVATVNRELGALKHTFNLARRSTPPRLAVVPWFPMMKENNTRTGFVEDVAYDKLYRACRDSWLRLYLELAYTLGWRDGELRTLRVRHVNLADNGLRLDPGTTKNGDAREVQLTARLREMIQPFVRGKQPDDYLITREDDTHVAEMRWAWQRLTCSVGLGHFTCPACNGRVTTPTHRCPLCKQKVRLKYHGIRPHDFRRSAAKAMRRAGVPESVCMDIMGHRTDSMFRRYAIVSRRDRVDAVERLEASGQRFKTGLILDETAGEPKPVSTKVQ